MRIETQEEGSHAGGRLSEILKQPTVSMRQNHRAHCNRHLEWFGVCCRPGSQALGRTVERTRPMMEDAAPVSRHEVRLFGHNLTAYPRFNGYNFCQQPLYNADMTNLQDVHAIGEMVLSFAHA